ncbi:similar to Saccharomyces cerevisiae YGL229C SAP4 Protein required for function of the Sit4p protein phosphatase [Maudiozyma saulgeensis]|uniref:Similar to Saccharomyces cerevisiae YGL229C SAP4 Protein required for function of the Sit4p protein phosphatase n=1 Tax=Maudiozyma saulgeensis TaxID=1789683 RepID=A0A1X7RAP2_9SACH|nr:similar to Saccharomyces cerevisiae YGL229C SAP4 Protein required for function of the Sit4p protein phosphatase [Kazachstania saulgeensis]
MSAWPFGQNSSGTTTGPSLINKTLDEYFHVLEHLQLPEGQLPPSVQRCNVDGDGNDYDDDETENNNSNSLLNTIHENEPMVAHEISATNRTPLKRDRTGDEDDEREKHDEDKDKAPVYGIHDLDSRFIEKILIDSELLNELNRQNNKLLDFLCYGIFYDNSQSKIPNLQFLIDQLIICCDSIDPNDNDISLIPKDDQFLSNDADKIETESQSTKFLNRATIISEIFSSDIWLITETLMKHKPYLDKIWSLLIHPNFNSEKSPIVSIFIKINQNLLFSKQDDYLQFILTHNTLVDDVLNHIDISMIMDFLLKLIGSDRIDSPTGIITLLTRQQMIPKLLQFLNNDQYGSDVQAYVGDFLKAIIAISANAPLDDVSVGPNDLTRELASPQAIDMLTNIMIRERGAALNIAVSVVIELIRKNNSDYDQINLLTTTLRENPPTDRDPIYLGYLLRRFTQCLPELFQIILDIELDDSLPTRENQLGETFKPLGFERFKIVELIAELLHCSNMGLMNSMRAERIAQKRDQYRELFLQDNCITNSNIHMVSTLHRLSINEDDTNDVIVSNENNNVIDDNDNNNKNININNGIPATSQSSKITKEEQLENFLNENNGDEGEEVDESFDIPYVKDTQNEKLRKSPTIGDYYKISLYDNYIIPRILLLFLKYPWNNFWHNVIFDIIQQIFNGRMDFSYNSFLVYSLFDIKGANQFNNMEPKQTSDEQLDISNFKITTDFILRGYQNSYRFYDTKNMNLGFMGHLVLIAEEVVKFSKLYKVELISPDIFKCLQDEDWQYYSEEVLNDTRMMYSKILGGGTYVEDGNGNIIPQLPNSSYNGDDDSSHSLGDNDNDNGINGDENMGGGLVNVESLEEQLSTESDLHFKLKQMLISRSRADVDEANEKNGVIILGPPPTSTD